MFYSNHYIRRKSNNKMKSETTAAPLVRRRRLNYFVRKIVFDIIRISSDDSLNLDLQFISDNLLECGTVVSKTGVH